jgi:hypothetical protein
MIDTALTIGVLIGWPVIPCHSVTLDGDCTCGHDDCTSIGKHPRTRTGVKDASIDEAQIRKWWTRWPDANIAIATGMPSGIYVIDLDGEVGMLSWMRLLMDHHSPPETIEVVTGSGGRHLYLGMLGVDLGNTAGKLGPGIDTRGTGGYVLVPPSNHVSGMPYEWRRGLVPGIAAIPGWIIAALTPKAHAPAQRPTFRTGDSTRYGAKALEHTLERISAAPEGERNNTLNVEAFKIAQLIGGGEIDPVGVADQLEEASTDDDRRKVKETVARALRDGVQHPLRREDMGR